MGVYNRDYMRDDDSSRGGLHMRTISPVVWLIIANAVMYFVTLGEFGLNDLGEALVLSRDGLFGHFKVHTLITYMFLHGSILHLAGNMVIIYFLGRLVRDFLGARHFWSIYFAGGMLGGLAQILFFPEPLVGASGGALALVCAAAVCQPRLQMRLLFPPITVTLKQIAWFLVILDLLSCIGTLVTGENPIGKPNIGHVAHLGGALVGWAYVYWAVPFLAGRQARRPAPQASQSAWGRRFSARKVVDAEVSMSKPEKDFVSPDVDAILDKISAQGMQSLTDDERRTLERSSRKLAKKIDRR